MSDQIDVEQALAAHVAKNLVSPTYTLGSVAVAKTGHKVRVHRGWPSPATLKDDIKNNVTTVTVWAAPGFARENNLFRDVVRNEIKVPVTFQTFEQDNVITFSGTATAGQVVGIGVGQTGYSIRLTAAHTPASVATEFGSMIPGSAVTDNKIAIDHPVLVTGVVSDVTVITEVRRQNQLFNVVINSPTSVIRDRIGPVVDQSLAWVRSLEMPDTLHTGKPKYMGCTTEDFVGESVYRRTERVEIEYVTTVSEVHPALLHVGVQFANHKTGRFHPSDN